MRFYFITYNTIKLLHTGVIIEYTLNTSQSLYQELLMSSAVLLVLTEDLQKAKNINVIL